MTELPDDLGMESRSSTFGAAVNIAKLSIGNGILALPYASYRGGLLFSPIGISVIAFWNVMSCFMMINCKQVTEKFISPPSITSSYSKISYHAFGRWGARITDLSVLATLFGVCVSYQIAFSQFVKDIPLHPLHSLSDSNQTIGYTYLSVLIIYPLACQKNIGFLAKTSLAGLCCLIVSIGVLIGCGILSFGSNFSVDGSDHGENSLTLWPTSMASLTTFSGVAIFCFGLCTFTFPIEESMKDRRQFPRAVIWSTVFVTAFYAVIGDTLALIYVHDEAGINQNILRNLSIHSTSAVLVRIALASVCLVSVPLALVPCSQMIEQWIEVNYYISSRESQSSLLPLSEFHTSPSYQSVECDIQPLPSESGKDSLDSSSQSSLTLRYTCRLILILLCSTLAGHVPCFELVVSLLGSLTVCLLSFVLPSLLHLVLIVNPELERCSNTSDDHPYSSWRLRWYVDALLTLSGCFVCIFATGMTAWEAFEHFTTEGHC